MTSSGPGEHRSTSPSSAAAPAASPLRRRLAGVTAALAVLLLLAGVTPVAVPAAALEPGPTPTLEGPQPGWPRLIGAEAAAILLLDTATGQVLVATNEDERRPVASTIKVLTALTVLERTELDDEVTVGQEVVDVPGSGVGLEPGDTWTVEELVDALIARSGNEAAEALAVHVGGSRAAFLELMEADAAALGVPGLELVSVSGLDDGNLLSAADLARISAAGLVHPELGPVLGREVVTLPSEGEVPTRNELLARYPDATGVKTGFTSAAGYSLVGSAERGQRELVAVVLGAGEDPARFELAARLLDLGFDGYEPRLLEAELRFAVAGGSVALEVEEHELVVPVGESASLSLPVASRPPEGDVQVPILVGDREVGRLPAVLDRSQAPAPVEAGAARIGRAAVDGVYAALRARAATQGLG
ncbi:MAG: D-alanyl-D-alanine carboxypeptidase [Nitriliruptor sp.]|nr:MAG: D-alanyl-D-alanine carboxypeptidase [Nitriliruptor sp.]